MNPSTQPDCPRTVELSALVDEALAGPEREAIAGHAAACVLCGTMLHDLSEQRALFRSLPDERLEVDIAARIDARLAPRDQPRDQLQAQPRRPAAERKGWRTWQLFPSGLAGAAVLAGGLYLGALLTGGAVAMRPAAMAAFDPVPPGGLCVGLKSCYAPGR